MHHDTMTVTDEIFNNPERGFHRFQDYRTSDIGNALTPERVKSIYDAGYTLILNNYYLTEYRDTVIPDAYLDMVRSNLQAMREGGCKCVLRFAYTSSENQMPREAKEERVLQHISQIKPILQEYVDIIFVMEAGFVGTWGEWYYTTYFKQNPITKADYEGRRHVLDALLDAMPQERMICVRTPAFKMKCFDWTMEDTLTRAEAFSGTPKARIACHDDAFMANSSDLGTFNTATQREYWEAETRYTIYGGESCPPGDLGDCDHTTDQMLKMHIGYLNIDYYKGTINKWKNGDCLDNFKRQIGYRFEGRDVATTKDPKAGEELKVKLSLVNVGFSSPKNPRDIQMLLINANDANDVQMVVPDSDPRFWFTDEMQTIEASFTPKAAGSYKLYLYLPDPKPNLAADPRFAIRLANANCWDEKTGYNYLTTVTVK